MIKSKRLLTLAGLVPFLASCNGIRDFINEVPDITKLFVGGYPIVTTYDGESYDYYLYLKFSKSYDDSMEYDVEIDLNNSQLARFGKTESGVPRYVDVGSYFVNDNQISSKSIDQFFKDGGIILLWTSVGRYDSEKPFCSGVSCIYKSGCIVSLSTISSNGEKLRMYVCDYLKEEFSFFGGAFK